MYNAFLERTHASIKALKQHLKTSETVRSAIFENTFLCHAENPCKSAELLSPHSAPDKTEWKIIDYCAAVTRIYAIYEQFAHEMIREHIALVQRHLLFNELPPGIQNAYRIGLSKIMEKKDGPRYTDLDLNNLIFQYNNALRGERYSLEPKALLMQDQNLRLPELSRLMLSSGILNIESWIENHRSIISFFKSGDRLSGSAASEMAQLVEYRNDAAHRGITLGDVAGPEILEEFCDFISAVCEAIAEKVQLTGLKTLIEKGFAKEQGEVTECIKKGLVLIGPMTGHFSVGLTVYLYGIDYCYSRKIQSIKLNDVDHQDIMIDEAKELGILIDEPGKKGANIIVLNLPKRIEAGEETGEAA